MLFGTFLSDSPPEHYLNLFFRKPSHIQGLEVDQFIWGIVNDLKSSNSDIEEVTITPEATWLPVTQNIDIKKEQDDPDCKWLSTW